MRHKHNNVTLRHDGYVYVIKRMSVYTTEAGVSVRVLLRDFHGDVTNKPAYTEAIRKFLEDEGYFKLNVKLG